MTAAEPPGARRPAWAAFVRLLRRVERRQMVGLCLLLLVASLTDGVGLLLIVPMLGLLQPAAASSAAAALAARALGHLGLRFDLATLLIAFVVLIALRSLVQFLRDRRSAQIQFELVDGLRADCFAALIAAEWRWFVASRRSDHADLLLQDVTRVAQGVGNGFAFAITATTAAAYMASAVLLSPLTTALAGAGAGLILAGLGGQHRKALHLGRRQTLASRGLHANVQESLASIKLSKVLGREARFLGAFADTMRDQREQQISFLTAVSRSRSLFQFAGAVLLALYLFVALTIAHVPVARLLTLVLIFTRLVPMILAGQQQLHFWMHALPAVVEADTLLADARAAAEPAGLVSAAAWAVHDAIRLEDVAFCYDGRDRPALDGVTITLPARTTTAVIGASGAGKSTLADIVLGLLAPSRGAILIDGVPVSGAARRAWRRGTAYVPQDVFLFHDTIRANLLWGAPEADDDALALALALRRAAAEFVFALPDGLDTVVGDGGSRLSGGERQRIALARALLGRPSLLVLDEATSALDVEHEARVRDAIERLHGDLTVLVIGHRLPTLEHADQVIVLDHGQVAASGSWADVRATAHRG